MQCPFIYTNGKRCNGYVNRIEVIKANIKFAVDKKDNLEFSGLNSNHHIHLYCSKKGNHAGYHKLPPEAMKLWLNELPSNIKAGLPF